MASAATGARGIAAIWEWYWRGHALRAAKRAALASQTRRERYQRAELAAEFADRQLSADDPLRAGSSVPLALSLYREAAYWALLANTTGPATGGIREAFASSERAAASAGLAPDELTLVRNALANDTFVESADARPELQRRDAELSRAFVHGLIVAGGDQTNLVSKLLLQRWLRAVTTLIILAVILLSANRAIQRRLEGPDLALGKPWRASSVGVECHPRKNECGGAQTAIFFHTNEEDSPWVEIDLRSAQSFSHVEVVNRDDCCLDRAVPLIIEVGNDREHWREVVRRPDSFREWDATFKPVSARYLRLRVDRHSTLHLVRISVRAK